MNYTRWTAPLLLSALLLALPGCDRQDTGAAGHNETLEVHYLEVPPDRTEALAEALSKLLAPGEAGSATVAGPGQILLRTDTRTRQHIEASLEKMSTAHQQSRPQRDSNHRVRLQVWAVKAGEGLEPLPPASAELKQALSGLPYSDWRQLETSVQTLTTDGRGGSSFGRTFTVNASLFRQQKGYLADLSLLSNGSSKSAGDRLSQISASARLGMNPGEYVLLSFRDERGAGEALVVRLDPIDAEPAQ